MADQKQVEAIMGPYRGQRLTMPAADADAAINAHWARDPSEAYGEHEPMTLEQRTAAFEAAQAWYGAQQDAAAGEESPPPEGGVTRAMSAEESAKYKTRAVKK